MVAFDKAVTFMNALEHLDLAVLLQPIEDPPQASWGDDVLANLHSETLLADP